MKTIWLLLFMTACAPRGEKLLATLYCNGDLEGTKIAEDEDCDGVRTADDCDDSNESLLSKDNDADCDGVLTACLLYTSPSPRD